MHTLVCIFFVFRVNIIKFVGYLEIPDTDEKITYKVCGVSSPNADSF